MDGTIHLGKSMAPQDFSMVDTDKAKIAAMEWTHALYQSVAAKPSIKNSSSVDPDLMAKTAGLLYEFLIEDQPGSFAVRFAALDAGVKGSILVHTNWTMGTNMSEDEHVMAGALHDFALHRARKILEVLAETESRIISSPKAARKP